jgi:hypothetical protein
MHPFGDHGVQRKIGETFFAVFFEHHMLTIVVQTPIVDQALQGRPLIKGRIHIFEKEGEKSTR